ncbi:MAG: NFACT family protein [Nitrososphaerota archaeon]|nr:NFACT family protein [Nitrososphaerota archaeon]MDG7010737.1 NFACT family protein [Nitrososphaerota archaeon]
MAELSGFEILVLAKEIDLALRGTYVNNIYTIGASQLIRFRRPGGEDVWLVVSPKKGSWVSAKVSERGETSEFTSKLRAELERARFSGAAQADLDRVFLLEFEGNERKTLVLELMPPGNLAVLDREGRVRLVQNEIRGGTRRLVRGAVYLPPAQGRLSPSEVDTKSMAGVLREEKTVGRAIGRHVALPRKYVADVLARLGVDDGTATTSLAGREEEVSEVIKGMVERARSSPSPCICETDSGDELFAFRPLKLKAKAEAAAMSELCDSLLLPEATSQVVEETPQESKRKELQATVSKLRAESESLRARASKAREAAKEARASTFEDALKTMHAAGAKPSKEPASAEGAASALYDLAKELEARASVDLETATRLEKRTLKAPQKKAQTKPIARRKGEWFEKFRWFVTGEGRLAIGGRDAQTNSAILSRHMDANDTVYHADLFGSPFFVLKGGEAQTDEEAREVAQATVAFSSAWKTGLGSADAYWVRPDQVSSAAPSGEYLAKGSFVIRGKKNFISKMMVELAVGVDREGRAMAGPEAAIKRTCVRYVILRPHNEKGSETARRVLKDLSDSGSPLPTLEEIQRALPAGGGKVVRRA